MTTVASAAVAPPLPGLALITRTEVLMDTFITIGVVRKGRADGTAIRRAFDARQGVAGMIATPDLTIQSTPAFGRYVA